uniref:Uncharacterized protein n=1 Tax=Pristionchus pacificus TaxID=54126 RepID=A0A2A6CQY4_PRIPA|eukprot:PDM80625.1 hypothetical protein PRIPAC_35628 [Pristionchus pacificus]
MLQGASAEWSEVFDDIGILLRELSNLPLIVPNKQKCDRDIYKYVRRELTGTRQSSINISIISTVPPILAYHPSSRLDPIVRQ